MEPKSMFEGFDPSAYEAEAKSRWGNTEAYRESARRTRGYSKQQWAEIRAESDAITAKFASALSDGATPNSARAMDVAAEHRRHIDRWFYPCSIEAHVGLGEMYVADDRFAANYEKHRVGLAQFVCDAIRANAGRSRT
jgi:hypothetical protein